MSERDFGYWWTVAGEWVEPPNERRNGWSGMLRSTLDDRLYYVKRQRNHLCRTLSHPFGWPTASREWHYLGALREIGIRVPEPVFHGVRKTPQGTEAVLVTKNLEGFVALSEQAGETPERKLALAQTLGRCLGILHRARLQHSSLYDKHVMVRWEGNRPEVALIDLEKMRRRLTARMAAGHDLEQLHRRQKVFDNAQWAALAGAHETALKG